MKGRVFLVHWNAAEAEEKAKALRAAGWDADFEAKDGEQAYKKIRANPPDVVVIDLSRLPSHGRVTAEALRQVKATRDLPIIFVDGTEEAVAKTRAKVESAIFTTATELETALEKLRK